MYQALFNLGLSSPLFSDCDFVAQTTVVRDHDFVIWVVVVQGRRISGFGDCNVVGRVNPDRITYLNLVSLSIEVGKIEMARQFHCCIVKSGFRKDCYVNSSLVDFTYTSLVNCCACLPSSELGKHIHGLVIRLGFDRDMVLASALTDMYAKNENIQWSG
ncbi:hypothetical protein L1887_15468 [Cichorium endivia]|nr:hypothetical protein L1887_15468 [Cichorium endivia]